MSTLLSLKWNHHHSTFVSVFSALKSKDLFCDVSVVCGSRVFPAHKLVLAASSPFFQHMLARQPQWAHPLNMVIVLQDIDSEDFEALLEYMYKGEASVPQNALSGLIRTAEQLQIRGLATGDSVAQLVKDNETMLAIAEGGFTARGSDRSCAAFHFKKNTLSQKKSLSASTASPKIDSTINENLYEKTTDSPAGFMNGIINREILGYENSDRDSEDVQNESPTVDIEAQNSQKAISEEAHENPDEDLSSSSATNEISDNVSPNQSVEKSGEERAACLNTPKKRSLSDPVAECQPERTKQRKHSAFEENKLSVRDDLQSTEHATGQIIPPDATLPDASEVVKQEPLYEEEDSTLNVDAHASQSDSGGLSAAGDARNKEDSFLDVQVHGSINPNLALLKEPAGLTIKSPEEHVSSVSSQPLTGGATDAWDVLFSENDKISSELLSKDLQGQTSKKQTLAESIYFDKPKLRKIVPSSVKFLTGAETKSNVSPVSVNTLKEPKSYNLPSGTASTKITKPSSACTSLSSPSNKLIEHRNTSALKLKLGNDDISLTSGVASSNSTISSSSFMNLASSDDGDGTYMATDNWFSAFDPQASNSDGNFDDTTAFPHATELGVHPETGDSTYQCRICSYKSHKRWDFMNHVRIHTGEKPFVCPHCPHRSALKNNLRRHVMLKHGASAYR